MFESSSTNSVQGFIRFLVWIISFVIISLVLVLPSYYLSLSMFETGLLLAIPTLLVNLYVSGVISGMFYILPEWQTIVLLRLGKYQGIKGAGFIVIPPFIYSVAAIVDMRIETEQVETTATLTKDNVPTKVTTAIEFKVEDPKKAVLDVQNYRKSVTWLTTEALKNTIGSLDLKELLSERDQIAESLRVQLDKGAAVYGVDVRAVRITDIDTPKELIDELAIIARARRAADALQIDAQAEVMAAQKYAEAADILSIHPNAIKLKELSVITEASKEGNLVIIYPYGDQTGQTLASMQSGRVRRTAGDV